LAPTITNDQRQEILALIKDELKDQKLPDWVNNLKVTGDLRLRSEWIEKANTDANIYNLKAGTNTPNTTNGFPTGGVPQKRQEERQQMRARLGFFEQVNDEATVGIQLITGGGNNNYGGSDPVSGNQTMGGGGYPGFEKWPVWFDLVYVDYHPKAVPGLDVYVGRMPNPFLEPGNSELIWSYDLRPEGMAVKYKKQLAEGWTNFASAGGFWMSEGNNNTVDPAGSFGSQQPDAMLWAAQDYMTLAMPQVAKGAYLTGGMSVYAYTHVQDVVAPGGLPVGGAVGTAAGGLGLANPAGPDGNTLNPNGTLYSGFDIFNPFVEVGFEDPWLHKRLAFFGDFSYNAAARECLVASPVTGAPISSIGGNALAYLAGVKYGELKKPGDWMAIYHYSYVGADSLIAMFDDANANGGGTNYYGSKLTLAYQIAKNWQASLSYYYDDNIGSDLYHEASSYQRIQFDIVWSF
jgi:hypothetical protein